MYKNVLVTKNYSLKRYIYSSLHVLLLVYVSLSSAFRLRSILRTCTYMYPNYPLGTPFFTTFLHYLPSVTTSQLIISFHLKHSESPLSSSSSILITSTVPSLIFDLLMLPFYHALARLSLSAPLFHTTVEF